MKPINFPESNESVRVDSLGQTIPIYENGIETICCYELTNEELKVLFKTGRIWVRLPPARPMPWFKMTVFSPLRRITPMELREDVVDKVIIHLEDDEELIFYRMEPGSVLNISAQFYSKVTLLGHAVEMPQYSRLLQKYGLDPAWTMILKRITE